MAIVSDIIRRGARADQPDAATVGAGTLYCVTDEDNIIERSSGAAWEAYSPTPTGDTGEWQLIAFSAADYTASGSMTWTVDPADATNVFYRLEGKTMLLSFRLAVVTIGGVVSTTLYITVPDGKTIKRTAAAAIWIAQPGPVYEAGYAQAAAGDTRVQLKRLAEGNWILSTNQTYIFGQLQFEVE